MMTNLAYGAAYWTHTTKYNPVIFLIAWNCKYITADGIYYYCYYNYHLLK
jgi:hypothetical protein